MSYDPFLINMLERLRGDPRLCLVLLIGLIAGVGAYWHHQRQRCPWAAPWQILLDVLTLALTMPMALTTAWGLARVSGAEYLPASTGAAATTAFFVVWLRNCVLVSVEDLTVIMSCETKKWESEYDCWCMSPVGTPSQVLVPSGYAVAGAIIFVRYRQSLVTGRRDRTAEFVREESPQEAARRNA